MIPCESCGTANPMGTRWCRQCGAKLNPDAKQIEASVAASQAGVADDKLLAWGHSAIGLGGFLLVAVVILRVAIVPALPQPEIPLRLPAEVIPALDATAVPALASDGNTVITSPRLRWRATVCRSLASSLGLDMGALDKATAELAKAQKEDGSWASGSDPLAGTALAALALQAWPSDAGLARAARAHAWLKGQLGDPTRRAALGRTLAITALDDAEALSAGERTRLQAYMMDGKVAIWQAWLLAGVPKAERPAQLGLVRDGLKDAGEFWPLYLDLVGGKRPELPISRFFSETVGTLTAEERPAWAMLAWHLAPAPSDMATILQGWSRAEPPAASAALTAAAGPVASETLWLLAVTAPSHLPPLWAGAAAQK